MKVAIPKISESGKKSLKNLNHQSSTTCEAGFVQPISCTEVEAQSNLKLRVDQWCYLSPLSKPTFGVVDVKTYHTFVPCEEIWHAFGSFLSGQSYHGSGNSYIPTATPNIMNGSLCAYLRAHGRYHIVEVSAPVTSNGQTSFGQQTSVVSQQTTHDVMAYYCSLVNSKFLFDFKDYFQSASDALPPYKCIHDTNLEISGADWIQYVELASKHYLIFGRYGTFSRNLMKICVGLGLEPMMSVKTKSVLPLIAYYKAWFDLFMPQRTKTWKDTNAFSLMEYIEQNGDPRISSFAQLRSRFVAFMEDLARCYYTDNVDFVSAHIVGQVNDISGGNSAFSYMGARGDSNTIDQADTATPAAESTQVVVKPDNASSPGISQTGLNVLKAVTQRLNVKSALGGRIDAILRSLFGSDYKQEDESYFIGTQRLPITFVPVMNEAQTPQGDLGEYAGRGMNDMQGKQFTYEAKVPGYMISFVAVVPRSKTAQGSDMLFDHIEPNSFYNPSYDSITLLPSAKEYIYGTVDSTINGGLVYDESLRAGFGNIVNYIEYKTHKNYLNGDMRLMSTRASFLPFTIDKLMPYTEVQLGEHDEVSVFNMIPSLLVASDLWRYVGLYPWYGNFNRIFQNASEYDSVNTNTEDYSIYWNRTDDNYILHNDIEMSKLSYSLSVADSWQTEAYGAQFEVEKA